MLLYNTFFKVILSETFGFKPVTTVVICYIGERGPMGPPGPPGVSSGMAYEGAMMGAVAGERGEKGEKGEMGSPGIDGRDVSNLSHMCRRYYSACMNYTSINDASFYYRERMDYQG